MSKILQNGKERSFIIDCPYCRSKIGYTIEDLYKMEKFVVNSPDLLDCPNCENTIYIKEHIEYRSY